MAACELGRGRALNQWQWPAGSLERRGSRGEELRETLNRPTAWLRRSCGGAAAGRAERRRLGVCRGGGGACAAAGRAEQRQRGVRRCGGGGGAGGARA